MVRFWPGCVLKEVILGLTSSSLNQASVSISLRPGLQTIACLAVSSRHEARESVGRWAHLGTAYNGKNGIEAGLCEWIEFDVEELNLFVGGIEGLGVGDQLHRPSGCGPRTYLHSAAYTFSGLGSSSPTWAAPSGYSAAGRQWGV
jgi:hypothetical protein